MEYNLGFITDEDKSKMICSDCKKQMTNELFSFEWTMQDKGYYIPDKNFSNESTEYNFRRKKKAEQLNK